MPGSVVSRVKPAVSSGINSASDLSGHRFAIPGKMASFKVHPSPPIKSVTNFLVLRAQHVCCLNQLSKFILCHGFFWVPMFTHSLTLLKISEYRNVFAVGLIPIADLHVVTLKLTGVTQKITLTLSDSNIQEQGY